MLVRPQGLALCRRLCSVMECSVGLRARHASSVPGGCPASMCWRSCRTRLWSGARRTLAASGSRLPTRQSWRCGWIAHATFGLDCRATGTCFTSQVFNPATGEVIATVPECKGADTNAAIAAAAAAAEAWAGRTGKERSAVLRRWVQVQRPLRCVCARHPAGSRNIAPRAAQSAATGQHVAHCARVAAALRPQMVRGGVQCPRGHHSHHDPRVWQAPGRVKGRV